jgi:hypothetical protein
MISYSATFQMETRSRLAESVRPDSLAPPGPLRAAGSAASPGLGSTGPSPPGRAIRAISDEIELPVPQCGEKSFKFFFSSFFFAGVTVAYWPWHACFKPGSDSETDSETSSGSADNPVPHAATVTAYYKSGAPEHPPQATCCQSLSHDTPSFQAAEPQARAGPLSRGPASHFGTRIEKAQNARASCGNGPPLRGVAVALPAPGERARRPGGVIIFTEARAARPGPARTARPVPARPGPAA